MSECAASNEFGLALQSLDRDRRGRSVTWLNHYTVLNADWSALSTIDAIGVDGTLLQLLLRFQGIALTRTSADISLPDHLAHAAEDGRTIALVGGREGIARDAATRLASVVLCRNGFEDVEDVEALCSDIRDSQVSVVVLGLGVPRQDQLAAVIAQRLPDVDVFTAGGWLDQLAAKPQYFPAIVHRLRLGWMWRILHEPRRLGRRYTIDALRAVATSRAIKKKLLAVGLAPDSSGMFLVAPTQERQGRAKVLQVVTQLERAGAQTMAKWLQDGLSREYDIETKFLYDKSGSDLFAADDCLATTRPASLRAGSALARDLRASIAGRDVVVCHTHYSIAVAVLAVATMLPKSRPTVVAVHHWPIDRYPRAARGLWSFGDRTGLIAENVFVSDSIRRTAADVVIPNPVPASDLRHRSIPSDVDLLIVARHSIEKSIETAIRAMASLPGRQLMLIGTGPETASLKATALESGVTDRIRFMGPLPNEEVRRWMSKATALILPSKWEAMPMVLLEATAIGTPTVVSRIDAHRFLTDVSAAAAFQADDSDELAQAVLSLEDESVRAELEVGRKQVCAQQAENVVLSKWAEVIRDSLRSKVT